MATKELKLYKVTFDGVVDCVEAASFGQAVDSWRAYNVEHNDLDASAEPDSVELLEFENFIRANQEPA